ncbi:MAG: hypothetical protein E6K70_03945 [Planctomycetota bacterium]|nr:MAG: hypothetical protein E6K70_03945 [Planctomycetota bacterium]
MAMKTIDEIVAAAGKLDSKQFLRLRQKLDRLEKKLWETELSRTTKEFRAAKLTDQQIDELIVKRRHESRR